MKNFRLIITLIFITALSQTVLSKEIELREVVTKVSKDNYTVLSQAEKLYQAKKRISLMRANLLPKLNFWKLLTIPAVIMSPYMGAGLISDIAPFLVPSNWFKLRQSVWSYRAQKEQYRALWANEVMTAKLLYLTVLKDQELLRLVREKHEGYKQILLLAQNRNVFGMDDAYVLDLVTSKFLSIDEDVRLLENLIFEEIKELVWLLGIDNLEELTLSQIQLPNVSEQKILDPGIVILKGLHESPELKQFLNLLASVKKAKVSAYFTILGTSNLSAGTGDGVYDNVPVQNGLGFGLGPSIKIAKSKERLILLQHKATQETIKKQGQVLVNEYNSLINNFNIIERQAEAANKAFETFSISIIMGKTYPPMKMMDVLNSSFASSIEFLSKHYQFRELLEKIQRLTFSKDYQSIPKANGSENDDEKIY